MLLGFCTVDASLYGMYFAGERSGVAVPQFIWGQSVLWAIGGQGRRYCRLVSGTGGAALSNL